MSKRVLCYSFNGMMEPPTVVTAEGHLVATVYSSDSDAKLFAYAPELLEALEALVENQSRGASDLLVFKRLIAKAKGETK